MKRWWKGHEVHEAAAGTKLLKHPTKGTLRVAHASFQSNDDPSLRLVLYSYISADTRIRYE